ncbi:hypothetical protein PT277_09240 [Acetobacteraceae bacterium ESL0709]|nr:hypothetical protein [Acetobacteraceae bacterium ESL0709]
MSISSSSLALTPHYAFAQITSQKVETNALSVLLPHLATNGDAPVLSMGGTQSSYSLPGQDSDPWLKPHALLLGAQRAGSAITDSREDHLGTGSQIILRGMGDGYMDMGCLICAVMTPQSVFDTRAGISSNLTINTNISENPSYDSVIEYLQPKSAEAPLVLQDVTYDATHIYLPANAHLTPEQMARIHPNQYVVTNSITTDVPAPHFTDDSGDANPKENLSLAPHNFYVSTVTGVAKDGSSISVNGWGIQEGNKNGHPWKANDVPTKTYDTIRSHYGKAVAMIGMPTQTGGSNTYMSFDPINNPYSYIDRFNANEMNIHYDGTQSGQATMQGLMISFDCEGPAAADGKCLHPTYDSTGLLINGSNLPNGIQNTIPSWGNEYKGYNFYIPGSKAPNDGLNNSHTSFESFTPTVDGHHQLITRQWVQQTADHISDWPDYSVNFGLVVDGTRWDSTGATGVRQGYISFDYSKANQGGVCIIGNNTVWLNKDAPGLCIRGDGSTWSGGGIVLETQKALTARATVQGQETDGATLTGDDKGDWTMDSKINGGGSLHVANTVYAPHLNTNYLTAPQGATIGAIGGLEFMRSGYSFTLKYIKTLGFSKSDRVWCDDCRNATQESGQGTGRWIFMDNAKNWRSDDGAPALD